MGRGWQTPIPPGRWEERLEEYERAVSNGIPLQYMVDIVRSVIESGHATELGSAKSHFDLIVAAQPADEPPFDVIAVRTLAALKPPRDGSARIEHQSLTGHDDSIERPVGEAVRLFWRFIITKFGINPDPRILGPDVLTRELLMPLLESEFGVTQVACLQSLLSGATIHSGDDKALCSVEELHVTFRRRLGHVKRIELPTRGFEEALRSLELMSEQNLHLGVIEGEQEWYTVLVSEDCDWSLAGRFKTRTKASVDQGACRRHRPLE